MKRPFKPAIAGFRPADQYFGRRQASACMETVRCHSLATTSGKSRLLPVPDAALDPARKFGICLGWLRLFYSIISESHVSPRRRTAANE